MCNFNTVATFRNRIQGVVAFWCSMWHTYLFGRLNYSFNLTDVHKQM